jgi:hypothetical protein
MNGATPGIPPTIINIPNITRITTTGINHHRFRRHKKDSSSPKIPSLTMAFFPIPIVNLLLRELISCFLTIKFSINRASILLSY